MADISKVQLPDGIVRNIKDTISGYITENDIPTNVSYFINDSGYTVASVRNTTLYLSNNVTNGDNVGY